VTLNDLERRNGHTLYPWQRSRRDFDDGPASSNSSTVATAIHAAAAGQSAVQHGHIPLHRVYGPLSYNALAAEEATVPV